MMTRDDAATARPFTRRLGELDHADASLPEAVSWEPSSTGAWSRDFRLGEWLGDPVTPLFESWLLTGIEDRMHRIYGELLGVELPRPAHVLVDVQS